MADQVRPDGVIRENGKFTLIVDGVQYHVSPIDWDKDYPALAAHMQQDSQSFQAAIQEIEEVKNPELQERLLKIAYADLRKNVRKITMAEVQDWIGTQEGAVFAFWLKIKEQHPAITRDEVKALMNRALTAEHKAKAEAKEKAEAEAKVPPN